ncbi:Uncharacterised protein [Bordetella pertussis]|nr:Uncharacterised protein [Bordetella pertussis]
MKVSLRVISPDTSGAFRPSVASWRFMGPDCASRPP